MVSRVRRILPDLLAGIPGALSSVPDGMAASVLAGVGPSHGLYAGVAGPIAGGLTSSTRLMVVSTTSAAALAAGSALASVPAAQRSDAIVWLTLVAGALVVIAGLARWGRFVRFVSHSVMLGFLTGVAVNMVLGQLGDLLGSAGSGRVALTKAWSVLVHPAAVDPHTALCGVAALGLLVLLDRTPARAFGSLVALAVPTVVTALAGWGTVARVSDLGAIPAGLPVPGIPSLTALSWSVVLGGAAVAVIVLVQGAGVAEAVPNRDGSRSSPSRDFLAQGLGNLASGLVGGQPVGGSVGQTALNLSAGARTRWAAVWSGVWLLVVLVVASRAVGHVVVPSLAAVLVYAGASTLRPGEVLSVVRTGTIPALALLVTLVAVLLLPVPTAVGVGAAVSILLQLNQEALDLRVVRLVPQGGRRFREEPAPAQLSSGEVVVLDVYGSLLFAGARTLSHHLPDPRDADGTIVVLRLRGRSTLGATFLTVVGDYCRRLEAQGGHLYLSGVRPDLVRAWRAGHLATRLAGVDLFAAQPDVGAATEQAVRRAVKVESRHAAALRQAPDA